MHPYHFLDLVTKQPKIIFQLEHFAQLSTSDVYLVIYGLKIGIFSRILKLDFFLGQIQFENVTCEGVRRYV